MHRFHIYFIHRSNKYFKTKLHENDKCDVENHFDIQVILQIFKIVLLQVINYQKLRIMIPLLNHIKMINKMV